MRIQDALAAIDHHRYGQHGARTLERDADIASGRCVAENYRTLETQLAKAVGMLAYLSEIGDCPCRLEDECKCGFFNDWKGRREVVREWLKSTEAK